MIENAGSDVSESDALLASLVERVGLVLSVADEINRDRDLQLSDSSGLRSSIVAPVDDRGFRSHLLNKAFYAKPVTRWSNKNHSWQISTRIDMTLGS